MKKGRSSSSLLSAFGHYLQGETALSGRQQAHPDPSIVITRETGAGALTVAELLEEKLSHDGRDGKWTIFDRNLAQEILTEKNLSPELEKWLAEDTGLPVENIIAEMLGIRPTNWTLIQQTTRAVLRLVRSGRAIIVGRGAEVITSRLSFVIRVRLVAPLNKRVRHAAEFYHLTREKAAEYVEKSDQGRRSYLRQYFNADPDNPHLYDMILNTGTMSFEQVVHFIAEAVSPLRLPSHPHASHRKHEIGTHA
jgi:cytidylate kinase